eukprot:TRINITY_DN36910_c0_g1_i1.p1 TRINITY_DN36910_c0_g1~~TRINITY_DN36910_c0_g1_i1.p1  ORF type:complete len:166 (+),score=23.49 TRINITY_DN36910_c0_g1_i1:34-498(+)
MADSTFNRFKFALCVLAGRLPAEGAILTKLTGLMTIVASLAAMGILGRRRELMAFAALGVVEMNMASMPKKTEAAAENMKRGATSIRDFIGSVFSIGFLKTVYSGFLEANFDRIASQGKPFEDCPLVDMRGKKLMLSELVPKNKAFVLGFGSCT